MKYSEALTQNTK